MKHGSVMPDVERSKIVEPRDISDDPLHGLAGRSYAPLSDVERAA